MHRIWNSGSGQMHLKVKEKDHSGLERGQTYIRHHIFGESLSP